MTTPLRSSDMIGGVYDKRGCPAHHARATRETNRMPVPYCTCGNPSCVSLLSKPAKCADCKLPFKTLGQQKYATLQDPSGMVGCIQAYCINEHDALPDMERIDPSPAVVYGGSYAQLNTGTRNTLLVLAGLVAVALGCGVAYLIFSGFDHVVNGLRQLSFW